MKILMTILFVPVVLGLAVIIIPILFPSFCFKALETFLDWKAGSPDHWDDT
jgi:hypothetical protein